MSWTEPKTWNIGEELNVQKLNTYLRDNENYLLSRPKHVITHRNYDVDISASLSVNNPIPVDDSVYTLQLDLKSDKIQVWMMATCMVNNITTTRGIAFDFLLNDTIYLSSMTSTALGRGLVSMGAKTAVVRQQLSFITNISGLTPGLITLKWRWQSFGATIGGIIMRTNAFLQIGVMEI